MARRRGSDDEPIRAFLAIDLDARARGAVGDTIRRLRALPGADGVRWIPEENLHVTLHFLGDIAPGRVDPLCVAVAASVAGVPAFELSALAAPRAFPPRRPRVVVLDLAPAGSVADLSRAVEAGVTAAGFEPERRPFRPHLTLGRARSGRLPDLGIRAASGGFSEPNELDAPTAHFPVDEAVLFRSELRPSGARYTALERMPLGGASPGEAAPAFTPQHDEESEETHHGS